MKQTKLNFGTKGKGKKETPFPDGSSDDLEDDEEYHTSFKADKSPVRKAPRRQAGSNFLVSKISLNNI